MDSTKDIATKGSSSQCVAIKSSLFAYCADELDAAARKEIEAHLKNCSNCRSDLEEYKRVIDVLLVNANKVISVPQTIPPQKRKRMLWLMERPFFAYCVAHHRMTALIVSLTTIALIIAALLTIKIIVEWDKPISPAVTIILEDPNPELPELDPEEPIPME